MSLVPDSECNCLISNYVASLSVGKIPISLAVRVLSENRQVAEIYTAEQGGGAMLITNKHKHAKGNDSKKEAARGIRRSITVHGDD